MVQFIRAKKAVVSNASMWDTLNLLPKEVVPKSYQDRIKMTPQCESFMHLHLGFDAEVSFVYIHLSSVSHFFLISNTIVLKIILTYKPVHEQRIGNSSYSCQ